MLRAACRDWSNECLWEACVSSAPRVDLDEVDHGIGFEFPQQLPAVNVDRSLAESHPERDLLAGQAVGHEIEDFTLARSQARARGPARTP